MVKTGSRTIVTAEPDWSNSYRAYRLWLMRSLTAKNHATAVYCAHEALHSSPYWSPIRHILWRFN